MTTDPIPHEKFANGMPAVDSDVLIRQEEAARLLGVSPRALEAWRYRGGGPKFIRISGRCIRYRRADLQAWIAERERHSTAEAV